MTKIYATLFEYIISGKYAPNSRLKEEEIAKQFNVSRTPVREALRQLEQDNLVEILPNRGTRVIGFSVDDVEEIYEIRKSLELLALRSSVPFLNIQDLVEIRNLIQETAQSNDAKKHEQSDTRLHSYFIEASGKRRLISILNQHVRLIQRFRELGFQTNEFKDVATKDHLALIDALCVRDVDKASEILKEHIEKSKIHAISQLVKENCIGIAEKNSEERTKSGTSMTL